MRKYLNICARSDELWLYRLIKLVFVVLFFSLYFDCRILLNKDDYKL